MVNLGADLVLAYHRAGSPGTKNCIDQATAAGLRVRVVCYEPCTAPEGAPEGTEPREVA